MGRRSRARKARRQLQLVKVDPDESIVPATAAEGTGTLVIESQAAGPSLSIDAEGVANPGDAVAASGRFVDEGLRHHQAGELHLAIDAYRKAVQGLPAYAELRNNLGAALMDSGELDEAIEVLEMAVTLKPDLAQAFKNLGDAWLKKGDPTQALEQYTTAVTLRPNDPFGLLGLAISLRAMGRPEDAVTVLQGALVVAPDFLPLHQELGVTFRDQGAWDWAADAFEKLVKLDPDNPSARHLLATALLTGGRWARGFDQFHHWMLMTGAARAGLDVPLWSGEPLMGRRILLWADGGVGETLMMLRYARVITEAGGLVHAAVPTAMVSLLQPTPWLERVSDLEALGPHMENLPADVEVHAPFGLLPALTDTRVESLPRWVSYLGTAPRNVDAGPLRVGLVLSGCREHGDDPSDSVHPEAFAPLFDVEDVDFVTLQIGDAQGDSEPFSQSEDSPSIRGVMPGLGAASRDLADIARTMESLDLVISVDAALGHLAGAMGVPVWVLLSDHHPWYWLADRVDTPWYPAGRLFRQRKAVPLSGVVGELRRALQAEVEALKTDPFAADV